MAAAHHDERRRLRLCALRPWIGVQAELSGRHLAHHPGATRLVDRLPA